MKRALLAIFVVLMACAGYAKDNHLLDFPSTTYDFGVISEKADPVVHEFEFTNTASEPVAVLSVSTGCGCTRPEYPVKPLMPGETSKIKVTFLPAGQSGDINKDIQVRYRGAKASKTKRIVLRLKGAVTPSKH